MNTKSLILIIVILVVLGGVLYFRNNKPQQTAPVTPSTTTTTTAPSNPQPSMEEPNMEGTQPSDEMMQQDSTMEGSSMEENMEMQNGTEEKSTTQGEVKSFDLEAGSFYFTPNKITVNQGDTVKITIHNVGGTHDWVLDEFNARTAVTQTGETASTTFVADKAGSFEFYCSIDSHRAKGMVGTLTVNAQ
jgi:nitrite reductase (NO-forming)